MIPIKMPHQDEGGSAFPFTMPAVNNVQSSPSGSVVSFGMSMRDWFAGQALIGIVSNPNNESTIPQDAALAYRMADAMLAERAKWLQAQREAAGEAT